MISKKEVSHIAKLARIDLSDKEIGKFQKELSNILDYFDLLKKADTSNVGPAFHPVGAGLMRKDEEKPESAELMDNLIKAAPNKTKRHIKVKSVF
jgi:aspartyl/glutamyl-tRNA(Asn/Gln) amidotransferase C subunit